MKFTPSGGQICVAVTPIQDHVITIMVSDTGPGIPQESIENLFDPFYQAHPEDEYRRKGLGIGLSIVKKFVDLHGGSIRVESKLKKGTTFHILLPESQRRH